MFNRLKIFKPLDRRLMAQIKSQRKLIVLGLACAGATSLLSAVMIPIVKWAVTAVQQGQLKNLSALSVLVIAVYVIKYWFTRGETYYLSDACARLTTELRIKLFGKLQKLPISYYNRSRTGIIQSVLTNDVGLYTSAVNILRDSIDGPIRAVAAFIAVLVIQWQLAAISLIFLPIMAAVIYKNGRRIKVVQGEVQRDYAELQAMTQESLYGVRIIKAFSAEDRATETFGRLARVSYSSQMRATKTLATLRPLVELIGAGAIAVVLLICGWLSNQSHGSEVADIAAVLYAFDVINGGFRTLGYVNSTYNQVQAAADRIYSQIMDQPEEIEDKPGAIVPEKVSGLIEFVDVSFTYPDGTVALRNVSFTIEPGTSLALVGSSGAGKSTIADLLLRFYEPTSGEILLDGVNIADLKMGWYRALIGIVPQHTFLFAGTIAENIRLGDEHASDEDVETAGEAAHASTFVESMPNKYESTIGEAGVGLSGGEKQRIAIARAVVRRPKLLILDEATSNLDAVSEKYVQAALDEIMTSRTTLFIAHRLTSAARADRILMLNHGECVETGTHQQLMRKNGAYAAMYQAFSSGLLEEPVEVSESVMDI